MEKVQVQIGSPEVLDEELPKLMKWLEKRVHKHKGAHPVDMVMLALVAAECCELLVRERWVYEEAADEVFGPMKIWARELAKKIWKDGERDRGEFG